MKPLTDLEKEMFKIITGHDFESTNPSNYGIEQRSARAAATLCERKMVDLVGWVTRQDSKTLLLRTDLLIKKYLSEEKLSEPQK